MIRFQNLQKNHPASNPLLTGHLFSSLLPFLHKKRILHQRISIASPNEKKRYLSRTASL